jgi:hypothetical protein
VTGKSPASGCAGTPHALTFNTAIHVPTERRSSSLHFRRCLQIGLGSLLPASHSMRRRLRYNETRRCRDSFAISCIRASLPGKTRRPDPSGRDGENAS